MMFFAATFCTPDSAGSRYDSLRSLHRSSHAIVRLDEVVVPFIPLGDVMYSPRLDSLLVTRGLLIRIAQLPKSLQSHDFCSCYGLH